MHMLITGAWQDAQDHFAEIEAMGHDIVFLPQERDPLPCDPAWIEGVIGNGLFQRHPMECFPNLRFIQLTSAGFDRVDMDAVERRGIEIHNAKGVYSVPMAEFAVASVLSVYKRLGQFWEQQERREWKKLRNLRELAGKRVLIIGCGDAGQECAKRFKAFDCEVIGVNRTVRDIRWVDRVVDLDKLDEELERADIAVVTIALNEATKGLVNAKRLRPEAILVNISRGGTVDTTDAKCRMILDVFDEEPLPKDSLLWSTATVTPHSSFVGEGNSNRLFRIIKANLEEAT